MDGVHLQMISCLKSLQVLGDFGSLGLLDGYRFFTMVVQQFDVNQALILYRFMHASHGYDFTQDVH